MRKPGASFANCFGLIEGTPVGDFIAMRFQEPHRVHSIYLSGVGGVGTPGFNEYNGKWNIHSNHPGTYDANYEDLLRVLENRLSWLEGLK